MQQGKVDRQPAYVLHSQPYRETSLLVEVLTRDHGRFTLVARGARRPRSDLRGLLLPFQPLQLAWFGKGELRTLHAVDWRGGVPQFAGMRLVTGFYLNELILRLAARDDPAPALFKLYDQTIRALVAEPLTAAVLRRFELALLGELGYAPLLTQDAAGRAIAADTQYLCRYGAAPEPISTENTPRHAANVSGSTLLAMADGNFEQPATRREARILLRLLLDELLGPQPLASRELLTTLYALND